MDATNSTSIVGTNDWKAPDINLTFAVFLSSIIILIVLSNLATIIAFWKERTLREKPSDLMLLSLSVADLCDGFYITLLSPIFIMGYWPLGELGCKLLVIGGDVFIFESLLMLTCISLDRLLLVSLHYSTYLKIQTKVTVQLTILGCWIIGMIPAVIEMIMWNVAKRLEPSAAFINFDFYCLSPPRRIETFALAFFLGFVILPVILVICLSNSFLFFLRQRLQKRAQIGNGGVSYVAEQSLQQSNSASQNSTPGNSEGGSGRFKNRYLKPALTLGALVLAMIVCMVPYCSYVIIIEVFCPSCNDPTVLYILILLMHFNPLLDPLLYAVTQSKIRNYYRVKIRGLLKI